MVHPQLPETELSRRPTTTSRINRLRHAGLVAHQNGAIALMFAIMLVVIFGVFGMAMGLSLLYNRKAELQSVADAAALAAARDLDGTAAGIAKAELSAAQAAADLKYDYTVPVTWSNDAISFSSTAAAGGVWMDAATASSSAASIRYVRVSTNQLGAALGTVTAAVLGVFDGVRTASTSASAIAGPSAISVTPLAVCAMNTAPAQQRANPASNVPPPMSTANVELVEYGFRRGVSYDLMRLNPKNHLTPANFLVNPIAPPGTVGAAADTTAAIAGPFVCAGTMAMTRLSGGPITVSAGFPIGTLFNHLNSRFDDYTTGDCDAAAAPPDANIRAYTYNVAARIPWMSVPSSQRATEYPDVAANILETVADPFPALGSNMAPSYGVLWSFARAVPYSSYTAGSPEPVSGYVPFDTTAWATLYAPGKPAANGTYPTGVATPYKASGGANFLQPVTASHRPGVRNRRVLNIPLLSCPVAGSSATVLGIGKFFMTVPATGTTLIAEFAGIASENALAAEVGLHP